MYAISQGLCHGPRDPIQPVSRELPLSKASRWGIGAAMCTARVLPRVFDYHWGSFTQEGDT
jgi:hypothetical protein